VTEDVWKVDIIIVTKYKKMAQNKKIKKLIILSILINCVIMPQVCSANICTWSEEKQIATNNSTYTYSAPQIIQEKDTKKLWIIWQFDCSLSKVCLDGISISDTSHIGEYNKEFIFEIIYPNNLISQEYISGAHPSIIKDSKSRILVASVETLSGYGLSYITLFEYVGGKINKIVLEDYCSNVTSNECLRYCGELGKKCYTSLSTPERCVFWCGAKGVKEITLGGDYPYLFEDSNEKIWVLWSGGKSIVAKTTKDIESWSEPIVLISSNETVSLSSPKIIQDSSNRYYLIWTKTTQKGTNLYYKISNDGEIWSEEKQLTYSFTDYNPDVALVNNNLWVVWDSKRTGNREIFYKIFNPKTGEWNNDTQLTNNKANNSDPSIIQDSEGQIWVVFVSDISGNIDIWYTTGEIILDENVTGSIKSTNISEKGKSRSDNSIDMILNISIIAIVVLLSGLIIWYKKFS